MGIKEQGGRQQVPGHYRRVHPPFSQRFSRPPLKNDNSSKNKDLENTETGAYKPAYKKYQKMAENQADSMPPDLAEIVQVWPGLPEHIKAVIKALVQSSIQGDSQ